VLTGGEVLTLPALQSRQIEHASEPVEFTVVHEDQDIIVVDKPAGVLVHPVGKEFRRTLLNGLHHRLLERGEDASELGIVHRLDRLTSGLLVVCKNLGARRALSQAVESRHVRRAYLAVVAGRPAAVRGVIDLAIRRDPARPTRMQALDPDHAAAARRSARSRVSRSGYSDPRLDIRPRRARTHWALLRHLGGASLLRVELETGRTHQIRVHMQAIGMPLLGDPIYGSLPGARLDDATLRTETGLARPALHAAVLAFHHPRSGQRLHFRAALPADLRQLIARLALPQGSA
jgi:23S rRNA pseudouridine1911/1915/1917 synthase